MLHSNQLPELEPAASEVLAAIITTSVAAAPQHKAKEVCGHAYRVKMVSERFELHAASKDLVVK